MDFAHRDDQPAGFLATRAMLDGTALPAVYSRYYRWWFYLGWPALTGVLFVFYLMVVKPAI
jgi:uncharacterized membrane protein